MRLIRRRRPLYGPPAPPPGPCNVERGYPGWYRCEKPEGHEGKHGRVIGTSTTTGGLIDRTSTTWEVWS